MRYSQTKSKRFKLDCLILRDNVIIQKRKYHAMICFGFLMTCFILQILAFQENQALVPDFVKAEDYPPFEPDVQEDFPTGSEVEPRIPHILHQSYKINYIPNTYTLNIKRFLEYNSDWKYLLWTEKSAWKLIIKRYPSLLGTLTLQMSFGDQSRIFRYAVLHAFGGVYADISTKWLRPIQKLTLKYSCIFTTLPFGRASLGFKKPYLLNNDLIFCRAKHPFLKQIIDDIPLYQPMVETEDRTGPHFVTSQFIKYNGLNYYLPLSSHNKTTNDSPYFFKTSRPETDEDGIFVPNSKYFSVDLNELYVLCEDFMHLSFLEKRGCVELEKRRGINKYAFSYTRGKRPSYELVLNFLFKLKSYVTGEHLYIDDSVNDTAISSQA